MSNEEIQELEKNMDNKVIDITMPLAKLLFLLLITLTLYAPFWFYFKWKYLKDDKVRNVIFALSTGIPFFGVITQFILYKNILNSIYSANKKIAFIISFSLSFLLFIPLYAMFLHLKITSSILFSICFYSPSLLIIQAIINKEKKNAA